MDPVTMPALCNPNKEEENMETFWNNDSQLDSAAESAPGIPGSADNQMQMPPANIPMPPVSSGPMPSWAGFQATPGFNPYALQTPTQPSMIIPGNANQNMTMGIMGQQQACQTTMENINFQQQCIDTNMGNNNGYQYQPSAANMSRSSPGNSQRMMTGSGNMPFGNSNVSTPGSSGMPSALSPTMGLNSMNAVSANTEYTNPLAYSNAASMVNLDFDDALSNFPAASMGIGNTHFFPSPQTTPQTITSAQMQPPAAFAPTGLNGVPPQATHKDMRSRARHGARRNRRVPETPDPSSSGSPPRPHRTQHNVTEKRYRDKLIQKVDAFTHSVPAVRLALERQEQGLPIGEQAALNTQEKAELGGLKLLNKVTKAQILDKAAEHIAHQAATIKRQKLTMEDLEVMNARLTAEIKRLRPLRAQGNAQTNAQV